MKLIDILVEELPKRGGWPEKVTHIGQDYDCELMFYGIGNPRSGIILDQLAADHRKLRENGTKITREQYESALAAKKDGWIDWGGGECPVEKGTRVDVRHRDGNEGFEKLPGEWGTGRGSAAACKWTHDGRPGDIIAYRLSKPQEAAQAKAGDEAGLNECISQDVAPVWNGEGLPPVGCECEVYYGSVELIDGLSRPDDGDVVRVVSHEKTGFGTQVVVVYWNGVNGGGRAHALIPKCLLPLRTEAERKRDESIKAMASAPKPCGHPIVGICSEIYDAIAAGEIPGVKLEGL